MKSIYVIGSLRNPAIPLFANEIRALGLDVFDDWFASGPETDDYWKKYEAVRGRTYGEAIKGYMAEHVFSFDKLHLDRTDGAVMLCPAGRSGHLELGYTKGVGKPAFMVFEKEPEERWDVMTQFCTEIFFSKQAFLDCLAHNYIKKDPEHPEADKCWCGAPRVPNGMGGTICLGTTK
jgi:hypothetical protein